MAMDRAEQVWLRAYLAEATATSYFAPGWKSTSLTSVQQLPLPDVSELDAMQTALQFLPFEGDGMLAIILSKAFLLADDRAITDPGIVRQIMAAAASFET